MKEKDKVIKTKLRHKNLEATLKKSKDTKLQSKFTKAQAKSFHFLVNFPIEHTKNQLSRRKFLQNII